MEMEQRPLWFFKLYPRNPRRNDHVVDRMCESIKEYGFKIPILARSSGEVVDGHLRIKAAAKIGLEELPVIFCDEWTDAQVKAFRLMVNKSVSWAEWDEELLGLELADLKLMDFDLDLTGFDASEIETLCAVAGGTEGLTDPDDAPAMPKEAVSTIGDLWIMGRHRLLCGDCTSVDAVKKIMGDRRAALMNTDPPYGVDYGDVANSRSRAANVRKGGNGKVKRDRFIANDDLDGERLQCFLEESIRSALPFLIENPAFYLWHPMLTQGTFFAAAAAADILIHRQIIWVKPSLIMGRGDYHWRHELCFYGWIRGKRCRWLAGRDQDTVWNVGRENDRIHPTQKPVDLFVRPITNHTVPGEIVYEPFSGSGSQIIAAEQTTRICCALEIEPLYVDVAVERWQNFTGKQATLEGDGRTFADIKAERLK